jgi:site-specific recombinase XerD
LFSSLGEDPRSYNAQSLRQFVLELSQKSGYGKTKMCTSALRMFLRFLISEGKCDDNLDSAIPVVAHWRLSSLPRYIQPEEVERVIASCDLCTPVGRRDRAILLLLARLGLRASDIVQIRLGDINWKEADIRVSGKGRCQTRLPLTQEVGDAIVDYLLAGRPQTNTDALFIRACPPFRSFASHCAVSFIVAQAMCRAGVSRPSRGAAHVLRHSAATSMLREGASLYEIAAVLRHRSIGTTQIYAKVDVTALQKIAQAWPEVQPC